MTLLSKPPPLAGQWQHRSLRAPRTLSWYTALLWRPGRTNRFGFVCARMCSKAHSARAGPQASWTVSKPQSLRALRSWPSASLESTSCTLRHDPFGRCKPACTRTPIRQTTEFERWTSGDELLGPQSLGAIGLVGSSRLRSETCMLNESSQIYAANSHFAPTDFGTLN